MRRRALLVCALVLLPAPAVAQSTAEDGIRAMLGGDYRAAARILRPLADDAADPVAQFFLAILYETGTGVSPDMGRACGLFLRSASRAHAFSEQSAAIAAVMQEQLGAGASLLCVADERWQGGPPQSFVLGPGHRIVFANTSVDVMYRDREQRTLLMLPPGAVFLPIQYTPLDVKQPSETRRHFFQWFHWMPDRPGSPSSWTLQWMLSEVVDDLWIVIKGEEGLAVVAGAAPSDSNPVPDLVRLHVTASGEAAFTIVGGPAARTEVIAWRRRR
jgi:hypothetical protein